MGTMELVEERRVAHDETFQGQMTKGRIPNRWARQIPMEEMAPEYGSRAFAKNRRFGAFAPGREPGDPWALTRLTEL